MRLFKDNIHTMPHTYESFGELTWVMMLMIKENLSGIVRNCMWLKHLTEK